MEQVVQSENGDDPESSKSGILFGYNSLLEQASESFVLGVVVNQKADSVADLQDPFIPPGLSALGLYFFSPENETLIVSKCKQACSKAKKKNGKLLVFIVDLNPFLIQPKLYDIKSSSLGDIQLDVVSASEASAQLVSIELKADFHCEFSYYIDVEKLENDVSKCFSDIKNSVKPSESVHFKLNGSSSFRLTGADCGSTEDLYNELEEFAELEDVELPKAMRKKMVEKFRKQAKSDKQKIYLEFDTSTPAFTNQLELEDSKKVCFPLKLKIVFMVPLETPTTLLHKTCCSSLSKLLDAFQEKLKKNLVSSEQSKHLTLPVFVNFNGLNSPSCYSHTITSVFGDTTHSERYQADRLVLHARYLIPNTRPTFKVTVQSTPITNKLINVHQGLETSSGLASSLISLVSGRYAYYHYNQDGDSDSGWGCAYRSLQTIVSWFWLNGYVDDPKFQMPKHRAIQQALVDVGDKPVSFVGSRLWIGSQEVCYVLSHLLQVQSKIMCVSSGADLGGKARELLDHFNKQGTPIMVGGGQLAHTLLGVSFSEQDGQVRFLVLDPHYVGDDNDRGVVQKKGWCGWKTLDFWDKNAFYNLCLPQRECIY